MVLVDEFFQVAHAHGQTLDLLYLLNFLVLFLIVGLAFLLLEVFNVLLFHQEIVFDPLQFELSQPAFSDGRDSWEFVNRVWAFIFLLPANAGRRWEWFLLGLILFLLIGIT